MKENADLLQSVDIRLVESEIVEDCVPSIIPQKTNGRAVRICSACGVLVAENIVRHYSEN